MLGKWKSKRKLKGYIKNGLKLPPDIRLVGVPNFGTEPYLIEIGSHVCISNKVAFITHDGGTWVFRNRPKYGATIKYGKIVIKDNCFIGYRVTILPGVTIGPNSVVGACSLVTRDVPPDTVVCGVPAKAICTVDEYAEKCRLNYPSWTPRMAEDKRGELCRLLSDKV